MSKQTKSYEQRQQKLEVRMRALLDRQRQLKERQRVREKDEMRFRVLSLGKICVAEGIDSPEALVAYFKSVKTNEAASAILNVAIRRNCIAETAH